MKEPHLLKSSPKVTAPDPAALLICRPLARDLDLLQTSGPFPLPPQLLST